MANFRRCILTTFLVAPLVLAIGQSVPPGLLQGVFAQSQEAKKIGMEPSKQMKRVIARLRTAYAAFNRGDFDSAVKPLDPQIEWTEPAEFPGGGTYHGRDAVRGYLQRTRAVHRRRRPHRSLCLRSFSTKRQQRMAGG